MTTALRLRHLTFLGPVRQPASIEFGPGLNVIYGASDTGKSFIVNTIDFMLGGRPPLADIPERVGYDTILLGMETTDGIGFTLRRSTEGGSFRLFDGLHHSLPVGVEGKEFADQHSGTNDDNVSAFLLSKIDLSHRRIRRNKRGDTQNLSFRNLARLVVVNEEEIIQKRSPLSDGNYTADTANTAVFKLLLTGVDDSSVSASTAKSPEEQSRGGQLDLLEQLISDYQKRVKEQAGPSDELEEQLERLDGTMRARGEQLAVTEGAYRTAAGRRRELLKRVEEGQNRLTEITSLLDRFTLLDAHYRSDVERLRGIEEAGTLFAALGDSDCPLCGAAPQYHARASDCEGDADAVVAAATAEIGKIELRRSELGETITTLRAEAVSFEKRLPRLADEVGLLSGRIDQIIAPDLRRMRTTYRELADKHSQVGAALGLHETLKDLEERKLKLEGEQRPDGASNISETELSTTTVDKFSLVLLDLLKGWHFPEIDRLHFDIADKDLVINGKKRTSYGKGLRAITQAAFTIGLLEYCRNNDTQHPGFVMLDSPLLSYREPENQGDDLRGTDLNSCFYHHLRNMAQDRQAIIVENTYPPDDVKALAQVFEFTGVPGLGRSGFFPREEGSKTPPE